MTVLVEKKNHKKFTLFYMKSKLGPKLRIDNRR